MIDFIDILVAALYISAAVITCMVVFILINLDKRLNKLEEKEKNKNVYI